MSTGLSHKIVAQRDEDAYPKQPWSISTLPYHEGRQTLIPRWMPTCGYPFTPDQHRDDMVQLQSYNRGATTGRAPNDARAILAPLKMSGPALTLRIEQANASPMQRITGRHLCALETITQAAGQPEVSFLVASPVHLGNDVVNF
jgi:hypothetical protein